MSSLAVDFPTTVLLLGAVYGIIFSLVVIVSNPSPARPKFWLGIFVGAFSLALFDSWGVAVSLARVFPPFDYAYYRCLTIIPLSMWLYVQGVTGSRQTGNRPSGEPQIGLCIRMTGLEWAAVGFVVFELLVVAVCFVSLGRVMDVYAQAIYLFFDISGILWATVFLYKCIRRTRAYTRQWVNNYTYYEQINLAWLNQLLLILAAIVGLWILVTVLVNTHSAFGDFLWLWIPMAITVFIIGIKGYLSPQIIHDFEMVPAYSVSAPPPLNRASSSSLLSESDLADAPVTEQKKTNEDYSASTVVIPSSEQDAESLRYLLVLMKDQKLYRLPKLSVKDVADRMHLYPKAVSSLINQYFQMTFSDFVNCYRVEEVKQRIGSDDPNTYTLLSIGLDAGFNSKSAFYHTFRQFTQMTPTQYRKKRLI